MSRRRSAYGAMHENMLTSIDVKMRLMTICILRSYQYLLGFYSDNALEGRENNACRVGECNPGKIL